MTRLHSVLRRAARAARVLRDAWLVAGISLALFLALEWTYRGQAAARRAVREALRAEPAARPAHPYAGEPWWQAWRARAGAEGGGVVFDPYRGWWPEPYASRYLHIDAAGLRVTPQPRPASASPRQLFMLGGSTMWGYTARDSFTIPAIVARRLHELGIRDVAVTNLAQSAFNSTQGAATLLLRLRAGDVPAAVVFLDGNNDVATAFRLGRAGVVFRQDELERRFVQGGRGPWAELLGLGRHSQLVARIGRAIGISPAEQPAVADPKALCGEVATYYANNVRSVEALAREHGIAGVFLWQPLLATTGKRLTAWEQRIGSPPGYRALLRRCSAVVHGVMANRRGESYFPLDDLFDRDTSTVFIDDYGHVTEAANGVIAERIVQIVAPLLGRGQAGPPLAAGEGGGGT